MTPAGEHLYQPSPLAVTPDSNSFAIDRRVVPNNFEGSEDLFGTAFEGVVAPIPRRLAATWLVEGKRCNIPIDERLTNRFEVAAGISVGRPRALRHQHGRVWPGS